MLGSPERPIADAPALVLFRSVLRNRQRSGWARAEAALWLVAAGCALMLFLAFADRAAFRARQSRLLEEGFVPGASEQSAIAPASATGGPGGAPAEAAPFLARLEIPAIELSALVVDGVDATTLRRGVGRIPASSRPGEGGDVALAGHRDTDFRALGELEIGDELTLRSRKGLFRYAIESIRIVAPHQVDVLTPAAYPTVTLVTCYPFRYVGPAPQRYVVRAREVAGPRGTGADPRVAESSGSLPGR
jgi:sortase A